MDAGGAESGDALLPRFVFSFRFPPFFCYAFFPFCLGPNPPPLARRPQFLTHTDAGAVTAPIEDLYSYPYFCERPSMFFFLSLCSLASSLSSGDPLPKSSPTLGRTQTKGPNDRHSRQVFQCRHCKTFLRRPFIEFHLLRFPRRPLPLHFFYLFVVSPVAWYDALSWGEKEVHGEADS